MSEFDSDHYHVSDHAFGTISCLLELLWIVQQYNFYIRNEIFYEKVICFYQLSQLSVDFLYNMSSIRSDQTNPVIVPFGQKRDPCLPQLNF